MKMLALLAVLVALPLVHSVPFSALTKIPFNFFTHQESIIGKRLGSSFITNIPSCIAGSGYTPTAIRVAVSAVAQPAVVDTDDIKSLLNDSAAQIYYAGQFGVLPCRVARDVVQVSSDVDDGTLTLTTVLGYQVGSESCSNARGRYCNQLLQPASSYRVNFIILDENNVARAYTDWSEAVQTLNVTDSAGLDPSQHGRSGGMIVITVLLSVAMFTLVPALIASLVVGREKSPLP